MLERRERFFCCAGSCQSWAPLAQGTGEATLGSYNPPHPVRMPSTELDWAGVTTDRYTHGGVAQVRCSYLLKTLFEPPTFSVSLQPSEIRFIHLQASFLPFHVLIPIFTSVRPRTETLACG